MLSEAIRTQKTVTIAESETASTSIAVDGATLAAVRFPAAMTGAAVTLLVGSAADDLATHYDNGVAASIPVTAGGVEPIPAEWLCFPYLALESDAAEDAQRVLEIALA